MICAPFGAKLGDSSSLPSVSLVISPFVASTIPMRYVLFSPMTIAIWKTIEFDSEKYWP